MTGIDVDEARRLYVDEGLPLSAVGAKLGCSDNRVWRALAAAGIKCRPFRSALKYVRSDFSGRLTEKAYLIGLRIGDLHVARSGSQTILVKCSSTRAEQVELFRQLFEPYGHVYTDEAGLAGRMRQSIGMEARLNLSFEFLLPKPKTVPEWILTNDDAFFAFFAGYVDAEGYFRTYFVQKQPRPLGMLEIRSYDSDLLGQLGDGLNERGIRCPPARLRVAAGYRNKYGVVSNQDLWGLGVHRRKSLRLLIAKLEPLVRHARRRRDMLGVLAIC